MQWSDISFRPPTRTLRQFSGLLVVLFGGMALWHGVGDGDGLDGLGWLAAIAAAAGGVGLLVPAVVRPLFVAWMIVAFPIGWTVSRVLLALVFYGIFTPLGLIFRLGGRDRLDRFGREPRESYWTPKPPASDIRSYLRQF